MTLAELPVIQKVAVVDDDEFDAEVTSEMVKEAGFEPLILIPHVSDLIQFLQEVVQLAQAAICDHRLSLKQAVAFNGANLTAELFRQKVPAVLISQFTEIDADVSIRRWRREIPVLISRQHMDPEQIRLGLNKCQAELSGTTPYDRRPARAIIRILAINSEGGDKVVDAIIPQWNPHIGVRFPASLVPDHLQSELQPGRRLLAMVNIDAERSQDLFLTDFEKAPDPVPEDQIG